MLSENRLVSYANTFITGAAPCAIGSGIVSAAFALSGMDTKNLGTVTLLTLTALGGCQALVQGNQNIYPDALDKMVYSAGATMGILTAGKFTNYTLSGTVNNSLVAACLILEAVCIAAVFMATLRPQQPKQVMTHQETMEAVRNELQKTTSGEVFLGRSWISFSSQGKLMLNYDLSIEQKGELDKESLHTLGFKCLEISPEGTPSPALCFAKESLVATTLLHVHVKPS